MSTQNVTLHVMVGTRMRYFGVFTARLVARISKMEQEGKICGFCGVYYANCQNPSTPFRFFITCLLLFHYLAPSLF